MPDSTTFDRKKCNLILIEVGFCLDFGCHVKLQEKTAKYAPLVTAPKALWGKVELVAVPIGHAGTTLNKTQQSLVQALSAKRPIVERDRARHRLRREEPRVLPLQSLQISHNLDSHESCIASPPKPSPRTSRGGKPQSSTFESNHGT